MSIRGLAVALNSNGRYIYRKPEMAVDHLIIGAGECCGNWVKIIEALILA
jgi:hypothetical protein